MKINQPENLLLTSEQYERQQFSLGDASVILMLLTQQYNKPIQTLTQEYICNARDANREVDSKKPIHITLPTKIRPVLEVRDFGSGITPERMENIFIKIASSTKRDTNQQTGGFGIGAKSAWAYTDKFNIVTFVDGLQRSYVAHYTTNPEKPNVKEAFLDQLTDVDTGKTEELTNEENGTLIQVPVRFQDVDKFRDAVWRAIFFWDKEERPEVYESYDGESFSLVSYPDVDIEKKYDNFIMIKSPLSFLNGISRYSKLIIIDGIPYDIPENWTYSYHAGIIEKLDGLYKLIATSFGILFETGQLYIPPTREGIAETDQNKNIVDKVSKDLIEKIVKEINSAYDNLSSGPELLMESYEIRKNYETSFLKSSGALGGILDLKKGIYKIKPFNFSEAEIEIPEFGFENYSLYSWNRKGETTQRLEKNQLLKSISYNFYNSDHIQFFVNDLDISEKALRMRLKQYMIDNKIARMINLNAVRLKALSDGQKDNDIEKIRKKLLEDFEYIPASVFPMAQYNRSSSQKKEKGKVTIHLCEDKGNIRSWAESKYSLLSKQTSVQSKTALVYLPYKDRKCDDKRKTTYHLNKLARFLNVNIEFGFIADKWIEKNKDKWDNLLSLDEFFNSNHFNHFKEVIRIVKMDKLWKTLTRGTARQAGNFRINFVSYLQKKSIDQIKDQAIKEGFEKLFKLNEKQGQFNTEIQYVLYDWLDKVDISKEKKILEDCANRLAYLPLGSLVILNQLDDYKYSYTQKQTLCDDFIDYANYIYEKKNSQESKEKKCQDF